MKNPQVLKEEKYMKNNLTFNDFCEKHCDGLYDPKFDYGEQCSGYKQLKLMVEQQITPATKEETERWEQYPTILELGQIPETKYMRSLHPLLRTFVRDNWEMVKHLKL